ncbi:MAG: anion permease [Myxococcales bacterium]|nr:MAG: anion permease [Myxococcales bacterium]
MTLEAWITLFTVLAVIVALVKNIAGTDTVMLGGLSVVLVTGVVSPDKAFSGFSNEGTLTVALLFVLGAAIRDTGAVHGVAHTLLGYPTKQRHALLRLSLPVAGISAFLNNTPVVAMMLPVVNDWARRIGVPRSRLLMPLSYAAILGGTCTLIGHSTNLVVAAMARAYDPALEIGMFDQLWVGLPLVIAGTLYLVLASPFLLPDRDSKGSAAQSSRQYTVAMRVASDSIVVNKTIEAAGLRKLPGLFLVEIERHGEVIPAPAPNRQLHAGDELLFAGVVESVVDLQKIRGLIPATSQIDKLSEPRPNRRLLEAVISTHSPLIGKSIRESQFRTSFNAAIIAVHRAGERIHAKVGDIVLKAGDTLLLEAHPSFLNTHRNNDAFALVGEVQDSQPIYFEKGWIAMCIIALMVLLNASGWMPLIHAALIASAALIITGCISATQARNAIDLTVVLTIAAAFGLGAAVSQSGLAEYLSNGIMLIAEPLGPVGLLTAIYIAVALLGAVVTTKAAAVLVFPIATALAEHAGLGVRPFIFVVIFASAGNFVSPIAYQTNLMVYGPGGYRFTDFLRFGIPLQIITAVITISLCYLFWV